MKTIIKGVKMGYETIATATLMGIGIIALSITIALIVLSIAAFRLKNKANLLKLNNNNLEKELKRIIMSKIEEDSIKRGNEISRNRKNNKS